jgi:hypothetical protein
MWLLALKVSRHETLHHALHVFKVLTQRLSYEWAVTQDFLFILVNTGWHQSLLLMHVLTSNKQNSIHKSMDSACS